MDHRLAARFPGESLLNATTTLVKRVVMPQVPDGTVTTRLSVSVQPQVSLEIVREANFPVQAHYPTSKGLL